MWLYVAAILKPDVLSPDVDSSVLVGYPFAERSFGSDGHPTTIYVKAVASRVTAVDKLLGAQTDPEDPSSPDVSVPSSALVAQAGAKEAFNTLFLGLGAIALLVGAIGVANIMVIAVLEGRSEIGLRRALGATRGTSVSSSCQKRSRWPWPAGRPGSPPGRPPPPSMRTPRAGPW
jgi:putative ABC transport system permease protein